MSRELTGAEVARAMRDDLATRVGCLTRAGHTPGLAIVRVGERPDDLSYERAATRRMEGLGIACETVALSGDVSQAGLEDTLESLGNDSAVDGILLFRPLPQTLDERRAARSVPTGKDVDGMCLENEALVFAGDSGGFAPCTAQAVIEVLDHYDLDIRGRRVVVLGRSMVIGRPLAMLLLARDATVTVCHTKTKNLAEVCREADILVCAVGRAHILTADMVRQGAAVIDVGINVGEDGSIVGDVDFGDVSRVASAVTPVPRGVGSVTTSVLAKHVVEAAERALSSR